MNPRVRRFAAAAFRHPRRSAVRRAHPQTLLPRFLENVA
jgi:hypothetical protein